MEVFAAYDHPRPDRPGREVDKIGDLGDVRAGGGVTAAPAGGLPTVAIAVLDAADRRMDAGVRAGDDREPDVAGPAPGDEPAGATSGIGADLHPATNQSDRKSTRLNSSHG